MFARTLDYFSRGSFTESNAYKPTNYVYLDQHHYDGVVRLIMVLKLQVIELFLVFKVCNIFHCEQPTREKQGAGRYAGSACIFMFGGFRFTSVPLDARTRAVIFYCGTPWRFFHCFLSIRQRLLFIVFFQYARDFFSLFSFNTPETSFHSDIAFHCFLSIRQRFLVIVFFQYARYFVSFFSFNTPETSFHCFLSICQ